MANWDDAKQLGVVWPRDRCAYCGERFAPLELVVLDGARALICEDRAGCFRRVNAGRQLRLPVGPGDDELRRCVAGMVAVDRMITRYQMSRAVEAIGHFLRGGEPGPPLFKPPWERAA